MVKKFLTLLGIAALATAVYVVKPALERDPANDYLTNVVYSPQPVSPTAQSPQTGAVTGGLDSGRAVAPAPLDPYTDVTLKTFTAGPTPAPVVYTIIHPDPTPTCALPPSAPNYYLGPDQPNYCR